MIDLAPIILFVYNRPWHTEQTLNALMQNELANESILYIYCDGAKDDATTEQKQKIEEVRNVIRKNEWCKKTIIIENEKNKGLANSIINGVSEIIEKHGKAIVLEDDLVSSRYFLKYMNNCLNYYDEYKSVFSISADRPPYSNFHIPEDYKYDVFASLRPFSTGWATWSDRWKKVKWSLDFLPSFLNNQEQIKAFNRGGEDLTQLLILQQEKKIDSWAIRFVFSHFIHHAVTIAPCISYIDNVGFDGSGTHSKDVENQRKNTDLAVKNPTLLDIIYQDSRIINSFYSGYYPKGNPIWKKVVNRVFRFFGYGKNFYIKKRIYLN